MTKLFPSSPLAAAQAFLLSLPAVRFEGLAGLCPAHEPETARSAGDYTVHLCELSLERYMGEADQPKAGVGGRMRNGGGWSTSAQRALNASLKAFIRSASLSRLAGPPRSGEGGGGGEERMMSFSPKPRRGLQKPQKWPKAFLP